MRDPKRSVSLDAAVDLIGEKYVSRGGVKLERALSAFQFSVDGHVMLDAGSSTGGFTDCLLRHGARLVHAVESGHNQLAYRLRVDNRVVAREDTPIQTVGHLDPRPYAVVADISFRSLRGVIAHMLSLTTAGVGIVLLKPQFEWSDPPPEFDGVVRDTESLRSIVGNAIGGFANRGVVVGAGVESPIRGHGGNREFLLLVSSVGSRSSTDADEITTALVERGEWHS